MRCMKRTAEIMSRSAPASVPSASVRRPSWRWMVRPLSVNDVMSVPIVAMASVTRKILAGPRLARSAMPIVAGSTWMPSAISPADSDADVERRAGQAGLAVADLAHGVEEMRDHRRAGFSRSRGGRIAGVGMAEADDDAGLRQAPRSARARPISGATVVSSTGNRSRAAISAAWSASFIGRISAGSCAPLRAIDRCGPSRCRPRKPGTLAPRRLDAGVDPPP